METIYRPKRDGRIDKKQGICPYCGADIDALNSPEAFNSTWTSCQEIIDRKEK